MLLLLGASYQGVHDVGLSHYWCSYIYHLIEVVFARLLHCNYNFSLYNTLVSSEDILGDHANTPFLIMFCLFLATFDGSYLP